MLPVVANTWGGSMVAVHQLFRPTGPRDMVTPPITIMKNLVLVYLNMLIEKKKRKEIRSPRAPDLDVYSS